MRFRRDLIATVLIVAILAIIQGVVLKPSIHLAATSTPTTVTIDGQTFSVEVADSLKKQADGLSYRTSLPANSGMLFPISPVGQPEFWMHEMKFPIDIVWIRNGKIVDISANLPPPTPNASSADLPLYASKLPIDSVLELNAGEAKNFQLGDTVIVSTVHAL